MGDVKEYIQGRASADLPGRLSLTLRLGHTRVGSCEEELPKQQDGSGQVASFLVFGRISTRS